MSSIFLPKNIGSITKTTESNDEDYLIIESLSKGTRLIKKKDLIASAKYNLEGGLYYSDANTISINLQSIATNGLTGNLSSIGVYHDSSLTARNGKLGVVDSEILKTGTPSSIYYFNTSGNRTTLSHTQFPAIDYWDKNGNLQTTSLSSYEVLVFDNNLNPTKVNINSSEQYVIFGAKSSSMKTVAANGSLPNSTYMTTPTKYVVENSLGYNIYHRWAIVTDLLRDDLGSVSAISAYSISEIDRIHLPTGRYILEDGYINCGAWYCYPRLEHYGLEDNGSSTVLSSIVSDATVGSNITQYSYRSAYSTLFGNGEFSITDKTDSLSATVRDYLKLRVFTQMDYTGTSLSGTVLQEPQMVFWKPVTFAAHDRDSDINMFYLKFRYIGPVLES